MGGTTGGDGGGPRGAIVSASRRTDIPAFYGEWLQRRVEAGWCLAVNPFNRRQVRRVALRPADVAALVFWTRDPSPFTDMLELLEGRGYRSLFLVTLTGYGPPLEPHAPPRPMAVEALHRLAERLGAERVVWRYDPVVLGPELGLDEQASRFAVLARELEGATRRVIVSLVDLYRKTRRRLGALPGGASWLVDPVEEAGIERLLGGFAEVASRHGIELRVCAEARDFSAVGAPPGACIDASLLERLFGVAFPRGRDRGQRPDCRCAPSVDIGMPDTCLHGCAYCYATTSHAAALRNHARHDPAAPALLPLER